MELLQKNKTIRQAKPHSTDQQENEFSGLFLVCGEREESPLLKA